MFLLWGVRLYAFTGIFFDTREVVGLLVFLLLLFFPVFLAGVTGMTGVTGITEKFERRPFSGRGRCGALCKKSIKQNATAPGSTKVDSLLLSLFAAPHNGATMGVKGSPEMGKNKNWQSTFLDTLVARKHRNISNIGKVKGSRKSTKFSTPFLYVQKSLNYTMIKRPWQRAQNRKL